MILKQVVYLQVLDFHWKGSQRIFLNDVFSYGYDQRWIRDGKRLCSKGFLDWRVSYLIFCKDKYVDDIFISMKVRNINLKNSNFNQETRVEIPVNQKFYSK